MAGLHTKFCCGWTMRFICSLTFLCSFLCTNALLQSLHEQTESDPLKIIINRCPTFKTCDVDGMFTKNINNTNTIFDEGCCIHCECSDACVLKGNCCHGKKRQNVANFGECVKTFVDFKRDNDLPTPASSFILQTSNLLNCKAEILAKCIKPNASSLIEVTPVTSNRINYRNVFCAKCNGHQDVEIQSWPTRISCENTLGSQYLLKRNGESDFKMLERLSIAFCQIFWEPLYPEETKPCINMNDIFSTCGPESFYDGKELAIIEKCLSTDSNESLTFHIFKRDSVYKNVVCAHCNYALLSGAELVTGYCTLPDLAPIQITSFITLMDMTTYNMLESLAHCLNYRTVSIFVRKLTWQNQQSILYKLFDDSIILRL